MWLGNLVSREFSRAFAMAFPRPVKVSVLSLSSALSVAGVAAGVFATKTELAIGGILLGATSILGWESVNAPAYEREFRENIKTLKEKTEMIKKLETNEQRKSFQMQLLQEKVNNLSENNEALNTLIERSKQTIKRLQDMGEETHQTIEDLKREAKRQATKLEELVAKKERAEEELRRSVELGEQAGKYIEELTQQLKDKNHTITVLERHVEDLTQQVTQLQLS